MTGKERAIKNDAEVDLKLTSGLTARYPTPLRYPGGKQRLGGFFGQLLRRNSLIGSRPKRIGVQPLKGDSRESIIARRSKGWSRIKKEALVKGDWEGRQRLSKSAHPSTGSG